eukprot:5124095-Pleurochrysis_carterae.AAC.1
MQRGLFAHVAKGGERRWIVRARGEGRRAPMGVSAGRAPPGAEARLDFRMRKAEVWSQTGA